MRSVAITMTTMFMAVSVSAVGAQKPTVSARVYTNYHYQLNADKTADASRHPNDFELARAYLTVAGELGNRFSGRITTDVDGRNANSEQLTIRLKYAYLAWKPESSPLTVRLGQIPTPIVGWLESIWGYRMQGEVAIDRAGYLTSADLGASVSGSWNDGAVDAVAGVYNGEGYSGAPGDEHKVAAARVSLRLAATDASAATGGLRITGFAQVGKATGGGSETRYQGAVSYRDSRLRLAATLAATRDSTGPMAPDTRGRVISAFGSLSPAGSAYTILARVDRWNPDLDRTGSASGQAAGWRTRYILGVARELSPQVTVMLDIDFLEGDNNNLPTRRLLYFHTAFEL